MAFDRPNLQEIKDRILSDFESRMTNAGPFLRRAVIPVIAYVMAGAVNLLYGFLDWISLNIFASSADTDELDTIAGEYGITRKAAQKAHGYTQFFGSVAATAIPVGTEVYRESDDRRYVTTAAGTLSTILNDGGKYYASIAIEAVVAGADGNEDAGGELFLVSPIVNVESASLITTAGLIEGSDIESDDALRARVIFRKKYPPHGGSQFDYVAWALEVPGVTRAWYYPLYQGPGTGALAFVRDEEVTSILPTSAQREEMREYIHEHTNTATNLTVGLPVTAYPGFQVVDLSFLDIYMNIDIYPNTDAVRDAVEAEIEDIIFREGGPGQLLVPSRMSEAISAAYGEERHRIAHMSTVDVDDGSVDENAGGILARPDEIHRLAGINWGTY